MADPHDFEGSTHHFGPPPGLEEMVGWLHVFSNGRCNVSAWKPTVEELAKLNAGESIFVSIMSGADHRGKPHVFATYVGTEDEVKAVVSDTGKVW
ncbi:MAG: hypothetical protein CMQ11_07205 [Gammaproteobacteria bacterium]|mgnify:CR=1 FL=1|nr:hypothetical protein [Gammaproteobacteria bacterium]|tara:strand:+ start:170 stop:454 length:285 start_codon:yes stop_codon:yes gene_type:complete